MWLILNFLDWLPTFFSWIIPASPPSPAEVADMMVKANSTEIPRTFARHGFILLGAVCLWIGVSAASTAPWFHAINTMVWTVIINMWARIIMGEHAYIFNWGYGWTLAFLPYTNMFRTVVVAYLMTYPTYQWFRGGTLTDSGVWNLSLSQLGLPLFGD
jgi:hypothetical protein